MAKLIGAAASAVPTCQVPTAGPPPAGAAASSSGRGLYD